MGKNKSKKLNSVFKVAGAKSLKLKAKAKAVKTELKHINVKNKKKVEEIDKQLQNLQDTVRKSVPTKKNETDRSTLPAKNDQIEENNKKSQEVVENMDAMAL